MFDEGKHIALLLNTILGLVSRLKWLFIATFYLAAFAAFKFGAALFFGPFIAVSLIAWTLDKEREAQGVDHFTGDWLFYRYGEELDRVFFSLPVKEAWDAQDAAGFCDSLLERLASAINGRIPVGLAEVTGVLPVTDLGTNETKVFLRVLARSRYGSMLTYFIHFAPFGKTITAHTFIYRRGTYSEWDVVKFAITSPFTIWFWGLGWILNRHSIIASLSHFRASSFDGIDFQTLYAMSSEVLGGEMAGILKLEGLITEETAGQIVNHFNTRIGNTFKIAKSPGAKISGVTQGVGIPPVLIPS